MDCVPPMMYFCPFHYLLQQVELNAQQKKDWWREGEQLCSSGGKRCIEWIPHKYSMPPTNECLRMPNDPASGIQTQPCPANCDPERWAEPVVFTFSWSHWSGCREREEAVAVSAFSGHVAETLYMGGKSLFRDASLLTWKPHNILSLVKDVQVKLPQVVLWLKRSSHSHYLTILL